MKLILFLSFLAVSNFSFAGVCEIEHYDGKTKPSIFAVKFLGPHNGFWSYVSEDPKTWIFAFRRLDAKALTDLDHDAHFEIGADNKFVSLDGQLQFKDGKVIIPQVKVKEAIDMMLALIKKSKEKGTKNYPLIDEQTVKLSITFQDAELAGAEEHICTFGFGTNTVKLQADAKLNGLSFEVKTNGILVPENGEDEVSLKKNTTFKFSNEPTKIQGLPWGAFEFFNGKEQMVGTNHIVYLNGLKQQCDLTVKKNDKPVDKKTQWPWVVVKNSCSKTK